MSRELLELDRAQEERAARLHDESVFIDGVIPRLSYLSEPEYRDTLGEAGVTGANMTVAHYPHDYPAATERITQVYDWVEESPENFRIVETTDDIRAAHENDQTGVILGFQDTKPLEDTAEYVRAFELMNVRIMQLTYNTQNLSGAGGCDRGDSGLTVFGEEVIDAIEEHDVLLDLSHCADKTTEDAIEYASEPMAFTHVGVRELCNARARCKTDDQIRAVADAGGVVGFVAGFPPFVKRDPDTHEVLQADIHDILDAIDYLVDLVGVDHVGIGTDMHDKGRDDDEIYPTSSLHQRDEFPEVFGRGPTDRYANRTEGFQRHGDSVNITRGLVARGYSDGEIRQILGENFLDLFERVWDE